MLRLKITLRAHQTRNRLLSERDPKHGTLEHTYSLELHVAGIQGPEPPGLLD